MRKREIQRDIRKRVRECESAGARERKGECDGKCGCEREEESQREKERGEKKGARAKKAGRNNNPAAVRWRAITLSRYRALEGIAGGGGGERARGRSRGVIATRCPITRTLDYNARGHPLPPLSHSLSDSRSYSHSASLALSLSLPLPLSLLFQ